MGSPACRGEGQACSPESIVRGRALTAPTPRDNGGCSRVTALACDSLKIGFLCRTRLSWSPLCGPARSGCSMASGSEFFIDNLLVRAHFIIVVIRCTGLAPWGFQFPVPGSLTSTLRNAGFATRASRQARARAPPPPPSRTPPLHNSARPLARYPSSLQPTLYTFYSTLFLLPTYTLNPSPYTLNTTP